jgi:hypothetical protein
MPEQVDIEISGRGFYQITARTTRGRRFMTRVQGNDHGTAYSDDSTLTSNIADGAIGRGLRVSLNGREIMRKDG